MARMLILHVTSPVQMCKLAPPSPEPGEAHGSSQERGLLYTPQLQSVRDRVRYIERAHSRSALSCRPDPAMPLQGQYAGAVCSSRALPVLALLIR